MAEWKPLVNAISEKQFGDEYWTLLAEAAGVQDPDVGNNIEHLRKAADYLAKTKDAKRFRNTHPDDLGKPGHPPKGKK
jgi:hypothetical protein